MHALAPLILAVACFSACTAWAPTDILHSELPLLRPGAPLLMGEQHDAPEHQQLARRAVEQLATQGRLAAVVLEMAESGTSTQGLATNASEADTQTALRWNEAGWPWARYGPVVMAAVRAGVPVFGGNLPRAVMAQAMRDSALDARLGPEALATQRLNIREGHCGLLPEAQIPAMARIQIARDRAMAAAVAAVAEPQRHVLLLAGGEHVRRELGVPVHLPPDMAASARVLLMRAGPGDAPTTGADRVWRSPELPARDHCAELRQQLKPSTPG